MQSRVFVLDDDQRVLELVCLVLRREGHEVAGETSFDQALLSLQKNPADLLVSDLTMPGVGGIAGIRALSRKGLIRGALVVSGFIDAEVERTMEDMPEIVGFLHKPFDIHDLAGRVRSCLESTREGTATDS